MVKKEEKKSQPNNVALSGRKHDLSNRILKGTSHSLQNKDIVVLDNEGLILGDFVRINNVFLGGNEEISTKNL